MARIAGVDIPNEKRIVTSLTYIFGIGPHVAIQICNKAEIDPELKTRDLTEDDTRNIISIIDKDYRVEGSLRTELSMNITRLMDIGSYRGLRHRRGLPTRGQRTKTNARTRKGPKKTIAGKKKATK